MFHFNEKILKDKKIPDKSPESFRKGDKVMIGRDVHEAILGLSCALSTS